MSLFRKFILKSQRYMVLPHSPNKSIVRNLTIILIANCCRNQATERLQIHRKAKQDTTQELKGL